VKIEKENLLFIIEDSMIRVENGGKYLVFYYSGQDSPWLQTKKNEVCYSEQDITR
jgi:hypothetical protein